MAQFTFVIKAGVFCGRFEGEEVYFKASSGGRAHSKLYPRNEKLINNPLEVCTKDSEDPNGTNGSNNFGPLPPGKYKMQLYPEGTVGRDKWIRLVPEDETSMCNRNGMAIHGPGNNGSIGCIVPDDADWKKHVEQLQKIIRKAKDQNGDIILEVKGLVPIQRTRIRRSITRKPFVS